MSAQTAIQSGSVATQVATFTEAFYHMDTFMTRDVNERILMRDKNKYASAYQQGMLWDDAITRRDNREAWYRPYVTIENVPLKNGPKVDNVAYGTYLGTNSPVKHLKKGWDASWGVFVGYNGSKQSYTGADLRQNGATLGFVGELYKKNFFTGLSINAGASMGKADTMYGTDDFNSFAGGVASKTGYNFEFKNGRYILQPTLLLGYSFIKTMDFTNSAGVKITSEPIHSIHVEPGVKLICPRGKGWRPYAHISVVANILDKAKFKANNMPLPETSIKPYVKYGVGIQKNWTDRMTSFFQTHLTHGGRNGIGFQLGFSWLF
jgi:outer membrane autotransporter protein